MFLNFFKTKTKKDSGSKERFFKTPVVFTFDDGAFRSTEWNMDGCKLSGYQGRKVEGNTFNIRGVNAVGAQIRYILIHARVVKRSRVAGELVLRFESMNPAAQSALDGLIDTSVKKSISDKQASKAKKISTKA